MKVHDRGVFTMCMFQRLNSMLNVGLSGQITRHWDDLKENIDENQIPQWYSMGTSKNVPSE